ncbi:MAG: ABC transporter substrate-binding protein, partial [Cyanobacteria bacterium HKST-UBA02]|nr:ABC transporter substrate-binding protein [Cyanobacteria bacterium HKST-UBA02]
MTLRIISLIASSTEIIHALDLTGAMVGRSHECDYPDSIKDLPVCTAPKFCTDGTSYEIDQRVKAIVQEGLSVYRVDAEIVDSLSPSHIITQDQCQVCAVSLRDVEEAACAVISSKPQIVSLKPDCLEDIFNDVRTVGSALQVPDRAASVVADMQSRIETVRKDTAEAARGAPPRVACIEWIEPLMAAGNWMPELVELASGVNI